MTDELAIGTALGDFQVVSRLGAGAMGVVYEAFERTLKRTVALKVLPLDVTRDASRRARFLREARAAAAVTHPTLLTVFQVGTVDERVFIAMELVRGKNLREVLNAAPVSLSEAVRIATDVALGLGRAHAAGIVHRDVKPDNVMLSSEGAVKLLDFGIARLGEGSPLAEPEAVSTLDGTAPGLALTGEGRLIGTPGYMAPEQSSGGAVDARADVFALGCMLYEMLAGLRPFAGETPIDILIASARDPFVPLLSVRPDVPAALVAIVERCLSKSPDGRPANGDALAAELKAFTANPANPTSSPPAILAMQTLDGLPQQATSPPATAPDAVAANARPERSRPSLQTMGLIVLGALAAVAAVFFLTRPSSDAPPAVAAAPTKATQGPAAVHDAMATPDTLSSGGAATVSDASAVAAPAAPYIRHDSDTVIGCPIFEASGAEAGGPPGWLGAAAADTTCFRLTYALGGDHGRTRVPAELLGLPSAPTDDFPVAPFEAEGARDRSITAAKKLGSRWIDGKIEVLPKTFGIELRIMEGDSVLVSTRHEGRSVALAVRNALDALVAQGAIARATQLLPTVGRWGGTHDVVAALAIIDSDYAFMTGIGIDAAVGALDAHESRIRPESLYVQRFNRDNMRGVADGSRRRLPPLDTTTLEGRFWGAVLRGQLGTDDERKVAVDTLAAIRKGLDPDRPEDRYGLTMIGGIEAGSRLALGEIDSARELFLRTVERYPRNAPWRLMSWLASETSWVHVGARAVAAWQPGDPSSWLQEMTRDASSADQVKGYERAVLLAPEVPFYSVELARQLVMDGQPMRARRLAARMADGGPDAVFGAETILASVDASEAKFAKAAKRAQAALLGLERFGNVYDGSHTLSVIANDLVSILGTGPEWHDAFARRFVLADPPRLVGQAMVPSIAAEACTQASADVAKACFARLRALVAQGYFTEGRPGDLDVRFTIAERFASGDMKGVAEAHRPFLETLTNGFAARAYDAIGDHDAARKVDERAMKWGGLFRGATRAHVREAKRAVLRKDYDTARKLAQTVIDAWGVADVAVPNVPEMKAILASLPPPAQ